MQGNLYLVPLVALVPIWWIFFDKAKGIIRITSYFRFLEKLILGKYSAKNFKGWETSVQEFRTYRARMRKKMSLAAPVKGLWALFSNKEHIKEFCFMMILKTRGQYWIITYYVFLLLTTICWMVAWQTKANPLLLGGTAAVIIFSAVVTLNLTWSMIAGRYSMDESETLWKDLLGVYENNTETLPPDSE
ncbi:MAG: hypothetical protein GKS05_12215 [Nitrospirales bacterium]|nr:hypothetical protein [Nitrospirales bacterium]